MTTEQTYGVCRFVPADIGDAVDWQILEQKEDYVEIFIDRKDASNNLAYYAKAIMSVHVGAVESIVLDEDDL